LSRAPEFVRTSLPKCHTAQGQHSLGNGLKVFAAAFHDDDFQAVMLVEMDVNGGKDHGSGQVLHFRQLLRGFGDVMVLDDGQGADHRLVRFDNIR
jgi:hypothetical protein